MAVQGRRTQGDTVLVAALLAGHTLKAAAPLAHVSEHTARRRMQDPAFQQQLAAARQEALGVAVTQLAGATTKASAALIDLVEHAEQESIRLAAARTIIETVVKATETLDLLRRLDALEQAAAGPTPGPKGRTHAYERAYTP
jgi:hypothetical protein